MGTSRAMGQRLAQRLLAEHAHAVRRRLAAARSCAFYNLVLCLHSYRLIGAARLNADRSAAVRWGSIEMIRKERDVLSVSGRDDMLCCSRIIISVANRPRVGLQAREADSPGQ